MKIFTLWYFFIKATTNPSSPDHYEVTTLLEVLTHQEMIKLGGALGLSHSRLRNMTDRGDMIAAWLRGDDSVNEKSGPSWSNLASALKKNGHTNIASKIRQGSYIHASSYAPFYY